MANIVITTKGAFFEVAYNDKEEMCEREEIPKSAVVNTCKCANDMGVNIEYIDHNEIVLKHDDVDQIDANTDISTNQKLYDALALLFNPDH